MSKISELKEWVEVLTVENKYLNTQVALQREYIFKLRDRLQEEYL